jgi:hypothetical protein
MAARIVNPNRRSAMKYLQFIREYRFAHEGIHVRLYAPDEVVAVNTDTPAGARFYEATVTQDGAAQEIEAPGDAEVRELPEPQAKESAHKENIPKAEAVVSSGKKAKGRK